MNYKLEINKITKANFLRLNETDVMFITNPGRMGDEDGTTFIVKQGAKFIVYRIDGWMYPNKDEREEYKISLNDTKKQFPKWFAVWQNGDKESSKGKYKYLYMGFGNGLSVDNSIYSQFKPYLDDKIKEYLKDKDAKESLQYSAIFNVWKEAFFNMVNKQDE